ncbi:unnamed protein product [Notodromas monacha]|uniref:Uncharacterized protein n=1 Tax=Notodromas monacha TaxID=399045 RepID=A0A7R9BHV1_9CRUS|nr:unnamed protein product [Notodromas monacha]CAG0915002.1 unnamed protein product [Notodromas monacha]
MAKCCQLVLLISLYYCALLAKGLPVNDKDTDKNVLPLCTRHKHLLNGKQQKRQASDKMLGMSLDSWQAEFAAQIGMLQKEVMNLKGNIVKEQHSSTAQAIKKRNSAQESYLKKAIKELKDSIEIVKRARKQKRHSLSVDAEEQLLKKKLKDVEKTLGFEIKDQMKNLLSLADQHSPKILTPQKKFLK